MTTNKVPVTRNMKTGSYTVHVPKDVRTGKFTSTPKPQGRIVVRSAAKKSG